MQNIKLSVALCTYNGSRFLAKQLDSILQQSLPVDEIIICDDNSTDATMQIIEKYAEANRDIIRFYKNVPGLGVKRNFEKAISLCTGDFIFLSDQDDIWTSGKTEKLVGFATTHPEALFVFTDAQLIDDNEKIIEGSLWKHLKFHKRLQNKWRSNRFVFFKLAQGFNFATGATVMIRATLKTKALPFPDLPFRYWHDAYLATIAASENGVFFLEEPLTKYRIHADQQLGIGQGVIRKNWTGITDYATHGYLTALSKKVSPAKWFPILIAKFSLKCYDFYQRRSEKGPVKALYRKFFKREIS
ncbi:MAG: glycosyltransferase family 2 protein [Ferruginibacter sp.]